MIRAEIHSEFFRRFSGSPLKIEVRKVEEQFLALESTLKTLLPQSYISFVTNYGPICTPDLLNQLVDARELGQAAPDGFDVHHFLSPSEIFGTHQLYISGGMDSKLLPYAMDSLGNCFGFWKQKRFERPDDLPVFFFDHDYCKISQADDSFDSWLQGYLLLENPLT